MLRLFRHYVSTAVVVRLLVDTSAILAAIGLAQGLGRWIGDPPLWPKIAVLVGFALFTLYLADLYRTDLHLGRREVTARLIVALSTTAVLTAAAGFAIPALRFGRLGFLHIFAYIVAGLLLSHIGWNGRGPSGRQQQRVLVLGVSRAAAQIVGLQKTASQPFSVLGFLDDSPAAHDNLPPGAELLGKFRDLLNLVDELKPDLIVVALPDMRRTLPSHDLLECRLRGLRVEDWPTFYEKQTGKILITDLRLSWLVFSDGFVTTSLTRTVKRSLDILFAITGLVLAAPLIVLIAIAIKLDSKGPVLFRQERVGQSGRIFTLNKFRSMRHDAERGLGAVWASVGDPRVTRTGSFLRKTRLDEIPQLVNVLIGDMSFVGPRPERPEFMRTLQRESPLYAGRLAVKPGITGWAQVRHQYAASITDSLEKLQYDLYYIKNLSPFLDLLILLNTLQVVLFARGAR